MQAPPENQTAQMAEDSAGASPALGGMHIVSDRSV